MNDHDDFVRAIDIDGWGTSHAPKDDVARPFPACTGAGCDQGRKPARCDCPLGNTELANAHTHLQLVVSRPTKRLPPLRVQVQHYPTPRLRLVKRFFRDLVAFLINPRFRP